MEKKKKETSRISQYLVWPVYFAAAAAVMNAILFFVDRNAGFTALPFTLSFALAAAFLSVYQKKRVYPEILSMAADNAQIQNRILTGLPVPYGLMDDTGRILWGNERLR